MRTDAPPSSAAAHCGKPDTPDPELHLPTTPGTANCGVLTPSTDPTATWGCLVSPSRGFTFRAINGML